MEWKSVRMAIAAHETPESVLRGLFGFPAFRPHQEEVVRAILERRDAFVVLPTGGGKSLCYQLPARILPGTCLVISPLISLMKDQVDGATATGLAAACLHSALSSDERRSVWQRLERADLDLLYVSPERFAMPEFIARLKRVAISFVAVDEAHCISEWGHEFRPDYLNLSRIISQLPDVPVAAFTATATLRVQDDIIARLGLRRPHTVRASFDRPNLFYRVVPRTEAARQILQYVRGRPGVSGIVYRTSRKSVEATAAMLSAHGIPALPYHAGLDDGTRARNQEAFDRDQVRVIAATIAFGMGIDKSDVRFVLHGDLPKSVENYYQESGRAGRDGEPAECVLLYSRGDFAKLGRFLDEIAAEEERARARRRLWAMARYAEACACRRASLLKYFDDELVVEGGATRGGGAAGDAVDGVRAAAAGEAVEGMRAAAPGDAGGAARAREGCCDVCAGLVERIDVTREAQMLLAAIARTGQRFGIAHVIDVVTGTSTPRIRQWGHDGLKTFGVGRDRDQRFWRTLVDNLLAQELIGQAGDEYPVLELRPGAEDVLRGRAVVHGVRIKEPVRASRAKKRGMRGGTDGGAYDEAGDGTGDEALFERLRELRMKLARAQGVPPYIVFSDRTLREMAAILPAHADELSQVSGVGSFKLRRYGDAFLDAIRAYRAEAGGEAGEKA